MNWIKATDRLPGNFESVIVWALMEADESHQCHEAFVTGKEWNSVRDQHKFVQVTHWMPFPAGPIGDPEADANRYYAAHVGQ